MMRPISLTGADALLVLDVQNDFLPGGSTAVAHGDEVIEPANQLIALYQAHRLPVFASRDWHPFGHSSFVEQGGPWPAHCIAHTPGAAFPARLALPPDAVVISKGQVSEADASSAFRGTGLAHTLRMRGIGRLAVCGLATDNCVLNTVIDALALRFRVLLVLDAIRAVDACPGDGERAIALMIERGAVPARLGGAAGAGLLEDGTADGMHRAG
jgi:nicotinamidase/pyrazinamidase